MDSEMGTSSSPFQELEYEHTHEPERRPAHVDFCSIGFQLVI
jgi:hypothetical protein